MWDEYTNSQDIQSKLQAEYENPTRKGLIALVQACEQSPGVLHHQMGLMSSTDMDEDPTKALVARNCVDEQEAKVNAVLLPCTLLATLCLNNKVACPADAWLDDSNLIFQLLFLSPSQWRELGIDYDKVDATHIIQAGNEIARIALPLAYWEGRAARKVIAALSDSIKPIQDAGKPSGIMSKARCDKGIIHLDVNDIDDFFSSSDMEPGDAARRLFLLLTQHGIPGSLLLRKMLDNGLDLSRLPHSLRTVEETISYWSACMEHQYESNRQLAGNVALSAMMIHLISKASKDISIITRIEHPLQSRAAFEMLDQCPWLMDTADSDITSRKLRFDLDI